MSPGIDWRARRDLDPKGLFLALRSAVSLFLVVYGLYGPAAAAASPWRPLAVPMLHILSNLALLPVPRERLLRPLCQAALLLLDIGLVSLALHLSGGAGGDLYLVYFIVILMSCLQERPEYAFITGGVAAVVYAGLWSNDHPHGDLLTTSFALRFPLFFITAFFSSFFVQQVRERDASLNRAEQRLSESEGLAMVGRLAGGIAHEFNNKLTAIIGHGLLLLDAWPPGPEGRAEVTALLAAANRIADLTRQLLAFSQKQVTVPRDLDLNAFLAQQAAPLRAILGEGVGLCLELASQPLSVRLDPAQLCEAIGELARNARDAMPSGGTFHLRTREAASPRGSLRQVLLVAEDTGCGMSAETVAHLFEPFFTTKPVGRGPGLGLASIYGVVRRAGGEISVRSRPGSGTAFEIRWPTPAQADQTRRARI